MAQKPITMEQIKQVLQLYRDGIPIREISRRVGISRNSVRKYLLRIKKVNDNPSDTQLADNAYDNDLLALEAERLREVTHYFSITGAELSKTGVTRQLLWKEYIAQHPNGYSYSRYCHHLSIYHKNRDLSMHLEFQAADMMMIDFAGKKQHYVDVSTGEQFSCEVFIAVLPYSGLIFCQAVPSQQTADFILCINNMLKFYRGVPSTILCDNLKTAVKRADRYEPQFTDICLQLSEHYNTTFSATRPYSPRDKAMVERAVNIIYTNVYAPLRNQTFTSLDALNAAMQQQLSRLNDKPYKHTPYSRRWFFEQQELPVLKPLPPELFTSKKVVILTVQRNYHIQLSEDHRYYSVPFIHVGKKVKVLYDRQVIEIYWESSRIALHKRGFHGNAYTTVTEHMPPNHQRMKEIKGFNREDLLSQAAAMGSSILQAATLMLSNSIYIEQNYKSCFGMLMLQKKYSTTRLEAACARALLGNRINYTMIKNILERGLDKQLVLPVPTAPPDHDNIRGKNNYQ